MPLRFAMLHSMLQIWHERMKVTMQSPESIANAKEMLILDGDCRVPYLQYNAQEKKMMIKTDRAPMEFQEVLTALETLQTLTILPLTVLRFHSTRRMEQDLKGETLANGPGDWAADGGSGSGMVPLQSAMPLGSMPSHGDVDESRQARQIGSGHQSAEDDRKHVRTLVLGNRRNYRYSNASFLALLWTQASIPSGLETAEHLLGTPLFSLWSRLRKLRPSITQHLWQQLPWRTLHIGWNSPEAQHDVVEYLTFLRPQLQSCVAAGRWEARHVQDDGSVGTAESGSTWPLWIDTPLDAIPHNRSTTAELQQLVDAWRMQRGLQGLTAEPPVLLIQANRFNVAGHRHGKSVVPLVPNPYLMLPVFTATDQPMSLELTYARYRRSAALLHEGIEQTSGHYRCILFCGEQVLITDDGRPAQSLNPLQMTTHLRNLYAFLYVLCPGP